ncbi:hypothetical protein [Bradyrhizobium sp. ARR65]|uniref:phosphorylase family protein n=1 Tax=Bradyrhizobium sp. ARR65 TaxID=1040989 RepID=UPI0004656084|nr:hypothetical protein [Bradyrhizobium sp. ARR65]
MPVTRLLKGPGDNAAENGQAIICVGLALEAEILISEFPGEIGGGQPADLGTVLDGATAASCKGVVSFGLAGGLSPELGSGDVVIASGVVGRNGSFSTDDAWSGWLLSAIPRALYAPIAGVDAAIVPRTQRRELGMRSGALAVDMESHLVAQFATRHGMRFVAVRVVIDSMHRKIPRAALACLSSTGEARMSALGRCLLKRPADTLDVMRLCMDWLPARKALVNCCDILSASVYRMGL